MLKPGDIVEILHPSEILKTLDANGTTANLPFMAEMIKYCGKKYTISSRIDKTCVECISDKNTVTDEMREFYTDDVVALDNLRCDGSAHGGCQTGCLIFWKKAWLKKSDTLMNNPPTDENAKELLKNTLKVVGSNGKYFCQATQLASATKFIPYPRSLKKLITATIKGNVKFSSAVSSIINSPLRKIKSAGLFKGSLKKTPSESLNLQPGEVVEVKSYEEILKTLDDRGCNRGLAFYFGMKEHCGKRYKVRNRIEKMINEVTGEMKEVRNSVILEDVICEYEYRFLGCPRQRFHIWREIWLKKVVLSND